MDAEHSTGSTQIETKRRSVCVSLVNCYIQLFVKVDMEELCAVAAVLVLLQKSARSALAQQMH